MKRFIVLLWLCFPVLGAWGQAHVFNGVVLDGSNVTLLQDVKVYYGDDTALADKTNAKGRFKINIPATATSLSLKLDGYQVSREHIQPDQRFETFFLYPENNGGQVPLPERTNISRGLMLNHDLHLPVSVKAHLNETYEQVSENPFQSPQEYPLSSFVLNANEASYCNVRRFITNGITPPSEAVRIEEMVNYFPYRYKEDSASNPVSFCTDVTTCPWNTDHWLMRLAATAKPLPEDSIVANNFVLLIDISGSMEAPNKLPLLKKAFSTLVSQLDSSDRVAVVVYAGKVSVALPSTPAYEQHKILDVIHNLNAGGSTAGGAGIELAFRLARDHKITNGNNRVIMATDGDFNVGNTSDEDMKKLVSTYHDWGIHLTCIGVGMGNYKDSKLETLARWGQGNFIYLDNKAEAMRIFSAEEYKKILIPVIRNTVFRIAFNPAIVKKYRLIGYENRQMTNKDSLSSDVLGGEMGYGQNVTAFYELEPVLKANSSSPATIADGVVNRDKPSLARIALQYETVSDHLDHIILKQVPDEVSHFKQTDPGFRFAAAVALFGMILRQSAYVGNGDMDLVSALVRHVKGKFNKEERKSFLKLVQKAERLKWKPQIN